MGFETQVILITNNIETGIDDFCKKIKASGYEYEDMTKTNAYINNIYVGCFNHLPPEDLVEFFFETKWNDDGVELLFRREDSDSFTRCLLSTKVHEDIIKKRRKR